MQFPAQRDLSPSWPAVLTIEGIMHAFNSGDDVGPFLDRLNTDIRWIFDVTGAGPKAQSFISEAQGGFESLRQAEQNPSFDNVYVVSQIEEYFKKFRLPALGTPYHEFISSINDRHGERVAFGSVAFASGIVVDIARPETVVGAMLVTLFNEGISNESISANLQSFNKQRFAFDEMLRKAASDNENSVNQFKNQIDVSLSDLAQTTVKYSRIGHKFYRIRNRQHRALKAQLEATTLAYKEQMRLKAPVDYWIEKSKKHRNEANKYKDNIKKSTWKIGLPLILVLTGIAWGIHHWVTATTPVTTLIAPATISILLTTVAFWTVRIYVRLFMSEHHLATDAEERAVMVQTYLALVEGGAASETERALVLAPIFRSSTDGIIKDDGAPDIGAGALLSRIVSR